MPIESGFGIINIVNPDSKIPFIDIENDFGVFVGTILSSPEKFASKTLLVANGLFSFSELSEGLAQATGKNVKYMRIPDESSRLYLPPSIDEDFVETSKFCDEYCFGPETKEMTKNSLNDVLIKTLGADEYMKRLNLGYHKKYYRKFMKLEFRKK